eukprot:CAMPEP_0196817482 /NCGR_PEP_ID=MMETSP1362-20130617/61008_1 /TAXON_ID=163516 /ORGANISM="Leptocylindrus danicus, Strain CCMP1856" /LENGTH=561 /DNA_ID=CAMNT_0042195195 /DNA_START=165 /DNA_END=1846 /DNA_ORIENTATION=+
MTLNEDVEAYIQKAKSIFLSARDDESDNTPVSELREGVADMERILQSKEIERDQVKVRFDKWCRDSEEQIKSLKTELDSAKMELEEQKEKYTEVQRRLVLTVKQTGVDKEQFDELVKELGVENENKNIRLANAFGAAKELNARLLKEKETISAKLDEQVQKVLQAAKQLETELVYFADSKRMLEETMAEEEIKLAATVAQFDLEVTQFQLEKQDLEKKIEEDRERLALTQKQYKADLEKWERQQLRLGRKAANIGKERDRKAQQMEERFYRIKIDLTNMISSVQIDAERDKKRLDKRFERRMEEQIAILEGVSIDAAKVQERVDNEMRRIRSERSDFEARLLARQTETASQTNEMMSNRSSHEKEKAEIQRLIDAETEKIVDFNNQIAKEMERFEEEKRILENKIADGKQERMALVTSMDAKFREGKNEMKDVLRAIQKEASREERTLIREFGRMIQEQNRVLQRLENDLLRAKKKCDELNEKLSDVQLLKDETIKEKEAMEARYTETIAQRDALVADLDANVNECVEKISAYESSFKEMAKLTVRLAVKKIRKSGSRART